MGSGKVEAFIEGSISPSVGEVKNNSSATPSNESVILCAQLWTDPAVSSLLFDFIGYSMVTYCCHLGN